MLKTVNLGLQYGSRKLFDHVNITFQKEIATVLSAPTEPVNRRF